MLAQDRSAPAAKTKGLLNPVNSEVATIAERNVAQGWKKFSKVSASVNSYSKRNMKLAIENFYPW